MTRIARPADFLDYIGRAIFILAHRGAMEQGELLTLLAGRSVTADMANAVADKIADAIRTIYRPDGTPVYVLPERYNHLVDTHAIRYHQDSPGDAPIAIVDDTRLIQPSLV